MGLDKLGGLLLPSLRGTARVAFTTSGSSIVYKKMRKLKSYLYRYSKGVLEYLLLRYSSYSTS